MENRRREAQAETIAGISAALTIIGVLGFALFPLALPIVVLTGVFAAPLLLPVIPLLLLAPVALGLRGVARRIRRRGPARPTAASASPSAARIPRPLVRSSR